MNKKYFLGACILLLPFIFLSQTLRHGPLLLNKDKKEIVSYVGSNDSSFFVQRVDERRSTLRFIEKYSKTTLKKELEVTVDLEMAGLTVRPDMKPGIVFLSGNTVYVFYNAYQKDTKKYFLLLQTVSASGKLSPGVKEVTSIQLESYDDFGAGDFILALSPDAGKLLFVNELRFVKKESVVTACLYDLSDFHKVYEKKLPGSYSQSQILAENYVVDNSGNVAYTFYYLTEHKPFPFNTYKFGYAACLVPAGVLAQDVVVEELDFNEHKQEPLGVNVFLKNGKLEIVGLFIDTKAGSDGHKNPGMFFTQIDVASRKEDFQTVEYFSEEWRKKLYNSFLKYSNTPEFKYQVYLHEADDGFIVSAFRAYNPYIVKDPADLYYYKDRFAAVATLAGLRPMLTMRDAQKFYSSGKWDVQNSTIIKFSKDGKLKWVKPIYINMQSNYGYVNMFYANNKMTYVYNDHLFNAGKIDVNNIEKNETYYTVEREYGEVNLISLAFDGDGKAERTVIQQNKDMGFIPLGETLTIGKNQLLAFFRKYERENFSVITFDK